MSIGFLVEKQTPMIWRGPMVISDHKNHDPKNIMEKFRDIDN